MLSQFEKACFARAAAAAELTCCRVGFAHEEQVEVHPEERRDDPERQGPCVQHRNRRVFLVKAPGGETMRGCMSLYVGTACRDISRLAPSSKRSGGELSYNVQIEPRSSWFALRGTVRTGPANGHRELGAAWRSGGVTEDAALLLWRWLTCWRSRPGLRGERKSRPRGLCRSGARPRTASA